MTKVTSNNPIVQKWIDGEMDAGGTIAELEQRVLVLESLLLEFQNNPNIELGEVGHRKIEEIFEVSQ